jgi:hypothetical protein
MTKSCGMKKLQMGFDDKVLWNEEASSMGFV